MGAFISTLLFVPALMGICAGMLIICYQNYDNEKMYKTNIGFTIAIVLLAAIMSILLAFTI